MSHSMKIRTQAEREAADRAALAQTRIDAALKLLQDTDWQVVRYAETGKQMAQDVAQERDAARKTIEGERAHLLQVEITG